MHRDTVSAWIDRWTTAGLSGLYDQPRSGGPPKLNEQEQAVAQALIQAIRKLPSSLRTLTKYWMNSQRLETRAMGGLAERLRVKIAFTIMWSGRKRPELAQGIAAVRGIDKQSREDIGLTYEMALLDFAVDIDTELEILRDDLNFLSPFAVEFRYPGENATVEESKDAVKVMRRVRRTLRAKLELEDA